MQITLNLTFIAMQMFVRLSRRFTNHKWIHLRFARNPNIFIINKYYNNFTRCNILAQPHFKKFPPSLNTFPRRKSNLSPKVRNSTWSQTGSRVRTTIVREPNRNHLTPKNEKREKHRFEKEKDDVSTMATGRRDGFSSIMDRHFGGF